MDSNKHSVVVPWENSAKWPALKSDFHNVSSLHSFDHPKLFSEVKILPSDISCTQ